MPTDLYLWLAAAYTRDKLTPPSADGADLWATDLDDLSEAQMEALVELGMAHELRLHRFKRTMELPRVRKVLGILRGLQPSDLLDVGSGRGVFLWPLLDAFPHLPVTTLDRLDYRVADMRAVCLARRV